ncbi:DUF2194 domain-containing protein [Firmicutes bacterium AM10-47]|nr:DUF2194 domain-containing protein [Firmicutes bacterium AM10-47]
MLSKRNFGMMITIILVILILFLSSAVLREYFNDYNENHSADSEWVKRSEETKETKDSKNSEKNWHIIYIGKQDTGYYESIQEWCTYRKAEFEEYSETKKALKKAEAYENKNTYLLISGSVLEKDTETVSDSLTSYVEAGGKIIFCSLPDYLVIAKSETLKNLLGIQQLRAKTVTLQEIWLYGGFLLGGETCYSFDELQDPDRIDMEREIPWYDISSRTKTYMVGFIKAEEQTKQELHNEDMPAIIWRCNTGEGSIFAVNGDYMEGKSTLGILDAMVYESQNYALYNVVNAQNLSLTGFPDLTKENEKKFTEVYGFDSKQFCQNIVWPDLVSVAQDGDWKITAYLAKKQDNVSKEDADVKSLVDYLKYFNEESAEAGISLGRMNDTDIQKSLEADKQEIEKQDITYPFSGAYIRSENEEQLSKLVKDEKLKIFSDVRTICKAYDEEQPVFSWMTDWITTQAITMNGYQYTYKDDFRLKSIQTALGYSNVQADIYRAIWPQKRKDEWEVISEKLASNISTYWNPFSVFEKTTITESDTRVRRFLNESVTSDRKADQISIKVENFNEDAWMMLRTHGEKIESMKNGSWEKIEDDAYLLHLTSSQATVTLKSDTELYYSKK